MERGVNEVDPRISVNPHEKLQMEVDQLKRRMLEEDQVGPKGGSDRERRKILQRIECQSAVWMTFR